MPLLSPLLMVKPLFQLEAFQVTILADSSVYSEPRCSSPSAWRRRAFSSASSE